MPADHISVVFTTLALNQTVFFGAVGEALRRKGYKVSFICFHQRSAEYLQKNGFDATSAYDYTANSPSAIDFSRYGFRNVNVFLAHEKVAFGIYDSNLLMGKLWTFLHAVEEILSKNVSARNAVMVQEFGGFLSLVAAFYAARSKGIDNIFIEPSFFRGRVVFVRNSFDALPIASQSIERAVSNEVKQYIKHTLEQQHLVIPKKDAHHYRSAFEKILDSKNIRRFFEKTIDKYVFSKKEEFEHIGQHVGRHITMFANSMRMKDMYRSLPNEPFLYYPLHVPNDAALTIRSPEFLDQYSLLDYLARILPTGYKLAIKEHPALVGAVDFRRMRRLVRQNDNVHILNPGLNNYQVMSMARAIVTVNSKSGAEALLLGKPVVVLGDAFYRQSEDVIRVEQLANLPEILQNAVAGHSVSISNVHRYFQAVWDASWHGELYDSTPENIEQFAVSLDAYLQQTSFS